jgi:two-component system sensor histidine kinase DesK
MERETDTERAVVSERRASRLLALMAWLVSTVWFIALFQPIAAALATGSAAHITLSLLGVALFLGVYLWATGADAREFAMSAIPAPQPLWRRALPAILITLLACAMTFTLDLTWGTLFIFAAVAAARRLPIRPALLATALLALAPFTGTIQGKLTPTVALQDAGLIAVVGVTVMGMRWSFSTNRELRAARRELARLAITEERLRFARDLHDLLGHTLSLIALKSELAGRLATAAPERAQAELADIERAARQALRDVRAAVAGYRQVTLAGELAATRELLAAAGIACVIHGAEDLQPPPPVETALAWAVREGGANIVRHSHARAVVVTLSDRDGRYTLLIEDDGADAEAPTPAGASPGNGLRGLTERVSSLGGSLQAGPKASGGYSLRVSLPDGSQHDAGASESVMERSLRP